LVENYYTQRRNYYKTGSVKNEYQRSYFRADYQTTAVICHSGVKLAGMCLKSLVLLTLNRNPYSLPK